MMTQSLYLIRHAQPEPDATAPASEWRLSHEGRRATVALAAGLQDAGITRLVASFEPKAVETARLLAAELGIPSAIAAGLHEHDRSNVGFLPAQERLEELIKELFDKPEERVFGKETANEARFRFQAAVERLLEANPGETLGVVSHGTVISLLVSAANGFDGYAYWKSMGMPDVLKVSLPGFRLEEHKNHAA
ncbi:MAG: histidine phosphatase family protein [Anaerolineae bacterium]|nr:MAG: histidine phosphatase family protein [Anaerolineae bacterium]